MAELYQQIEDRYRRFLALMLLYPGKEIVPTLVIDECWHAHIQDIVANHRDCHHSTILGLTAHISAKKITQPQSQKPHEFLKRAECANKPMS